MLSSQEIADMTATVNSSLDVSMPFYHKTTGLDGYGHSTETYPGTPSATYKVNAYNPSATQLQAFAGIIGSQEALMIRFATTSDIREGDRAVYVGKNWIVQNILNAESFTFANNALITTLA